MNTMSAAATDGWRLLCKQHPLCCLAEQHQEEEDDRAIIHDMGKINTESTRLPDY